MLASLASYPGEGSPREELWVNDAGCLAKCSIQPAGIEYILLFLIGGGAHGELGDASSTDEEAAVGPLSLRAGEATVFRAHAGRPQTDTHTHTHTYIYNIYIYIYIMNGILVPCIQ